MYYVIDYLENPSAIDPNADLEIHEEDIHIPGVEVWQSGQRFQEPIATPILFEATPHHGYVGPPHDYYDGSISYMSARLAEVLKKNGVDNLDLYAARIRYRTNNETYDVLAFNLLGLVSATDLAKSNLTSFDGDFKMDSSVRGFVVDPHKARSLAMFRLAENCMTVLVHERIRAAIDSAGIRTFAFKDPSEWVQV